MEVLTVTLTANERTTFNMPGRFFMLVEAGAPMDVSFLKNRGGTSHEVARAVEAGFVREPGDWSNPKDGAFEGVVLQSDVNQTCRIGISEFSADYRRVVGIVQVETGNAGATVADQAMGASSIEISPANASRISVTVQNTSALGHNLRVGPGVVTGSRGLRLQEGEWHTFHTKAAINGIGVAGGSPTVAVIEETRE